jgi:hypothetical protein
LKVGNQAALRWLKHSGVTCRPSKSSDDIGESEKSGVGEAHVNVTEPQGEPSPGERHEKCPKPKAEPRRPERNSWKREDTDGRGSLVPEGGGQGALFQPEWNRGSLQTEQAAELFQRKPLTGRRERPHPVAGTVR